MRQIFKQNVWNRMYGRDDSESHSDSEEETISPPHKHDKQEVKKYTVLPPPEGYISSPLEEVNARVTSSDSSDEDLEPKKKRKRKKERHKDKCADKKLQQSNPGDITLTKNQKRKLKKKRRKEKLKSEAKSVPFSFSISNDNQASVDAEILDIDRCVEDLRIFFDAIWDIYQMQEKDKSSEKQLLLTQLNDFLKSTDKHNGGQIKLMKNIQKIKKLIVLGDFKAATDDILVLKSICCPLISDDLCNFMVTLFEYWMKNISKK